MRFSQKAQSAYNYKMLLRYTLCTDAPHSTVRRFCMELNVHMVHTEITGRWRTAAREWHAYYKPYGFLDDPPLKVPSFFT